MQSIEMIQLVYDRSPEELQQALKINPTLITAQDEHGRTLLHHAASFGSSCEWYS